MKIRRFTFSDWLLACFLLGVLGGTGAACLFGGEIGGETFLQGLSPGGPAQARASFFYVWKFRLLQLAVGWLAGLTVCSGVLFGLIFFWAGASVAVSLSVFTWQKGLAGGAAFLARSFPCILFYAPVWLILAVWAGKTPKRPRLLSLVLLALILAAGALMETWLGPLLYGWIF